MKLAVKIAVLFSIIVLLGILCSCQNQATKQNVSNFESTNDSTVATESATVSDSETESVSAENSNGEDSNLSLNTDFHYSTWGMSKEEVMRAESELTLVDAGDYLIAEDAAVAQEDASLLFVFDNNKLVSGMVQFTAQHSNENLYLDDYDAINESLIEKYGMASVDEKQWKDTLYQDDPEDWGFAVSLGDLVLISSWETDTTEIRHMLTGDNYEVTHGILYIQIGYQTENNTDGL